MRIVPALAISLVAFSSAAFADAHILSSVPADAKTVTSLYKQNVYDPSNTKIGDVADVLIGKDGKVLALVIGVGGFLGIQEKDVLVPMDEVHSNIQDGNVRLSMDTNKDALKAAPGFTYNRDTMTWTQAKS